MLKNNKILYTAWPLFLATLIFSGCAHQPSQTNLIEDAAIIAAEATIESETNLALVALQKNADPEHSNLSHVKSTTATEDAITAAAAPEQTTQFENDDIWQRLRNGFTLAQSDHTRTRSEREWYARHQDYIDRTIERAAPYMYMILEEAEQRGIPSEIALLPIVESAFQPFAYSHGRAAGIWQFIPSTGRIYGLKQDWWYDGRRDIEASTKAALKYLDQLQKTFDGDWLLALAAYNSGQGTVKKAIRYNQRHGKPTDFWSLRLPKETRAYVPKLLAISAIFNDPAQYGVTLKPLPNRPYLTKVATESQIDLALAADMANIPLQELYRLNPAFNRWATSPTGPHHLLLPIESAERFTTQLAELPASKRIKWERHKIRNGETLGHIADKYNTTVAMLRRVNKLNGHMIRAGKNLIIPVATKRLSNYSLSATQRSRTIRNTPQQGKKINYTVKRGDNLWDISRKYHVGVRQLAKWNGMAPRDVLRQGQRLVIWWKQPKSAADDNKLDASVLISNDTLQRVNYIVRQGDSLARISQRFNVKISQLRRWNVLPKGKYLQPGQKITLFVDVRSQSDNG